MMLRHWVKAMKIRQCYYTMSLFYNIFSSYVNKLKINWLKRWLQSLDRGILPKIYVKK